VNIDGEEKLIFTISQKSNLFPKINQFISKIHRRGLLTKQSAEGWKNRFLKKNQPSGFFYIYFLLFYGFFEKDLGFLGKLSIISTESD
jgi:hypothetical protein